MKVNWTVVTTALIVSVVVVYSSNHDVPLLGHAVRRAIG